MTTTADSERSGQKGKNPAFSLSFTEMHYPFLDSWLREVLLDPEERYGTLPVNIILVLTGTKELSKRDWEEYGELIAHWHLEPFTEDEVRQYLAHKGINDLQVVNEILRRRLTSLGRNFSY
jgi:hypothetical protein